LGTTEPILVLNEFPSKEQFEQAAAELAIDPTLVEKDWYVTQVLAFIANLNLPGYEILFTGGTSLSKAHGLIKRFSEDIDFKVITEGATDRKTLSAFKNAVVDALQNAGFPMDRDSLKPRDGNKFFSIDINYDTHFAPVAGLRPHIQLEVSVNPSELSHIERPVQSLLAKLKKDPAEVDKIACVDPVEIAADKLSALVWRIPKQGSEEQPNDRSLVRHIHDLAALEKTVQEGVDFPSLVVVALQRDNERNKEISAHSEEEKFALLLDTLSKDHKKYREEYDTFVKSVSYAPEGVVPDFDTAVKALERLVNIVRSSKSSN
jgi:hypothetical protein